MVIKKQTGMLFFFALALVLSGCQSEEEQLLVATGDVFIKSNQAFRSVYLNRSMKYDILLPGNYNGELEKNYPVLYLLHGMDGNNTSWATDGNLKKQVQEAIDNGSIPEIIVVMPDGFNTFYCNGYQDNLPYKDYFFDEFMPIIENTYRIKTERTSRFIAGLSMGGYGTLYYAFLHPEMFCYAYAMSPAIDVPRTPSINSLASDASPDGLPAITIDVGTEDFLVFSGADVFEKTLTKSGIEHDYITRPGTHNWVFWQEAIQTTLKRIGTFLK